MHGVRAWVLAVGLLCCVFWAARVRALSPEPSDLGSRAEQPPPSTSLDSAATRETAPPGYQQAAELGFQEYERGNYEEARARFLQAHRLWPNARVLRALGHCEFELEHYVAAVEFLQQTLSSSVRPLNDTQRRETEQLLLRAQSHVARCTVLTVPREATVLIDGVEATRDVAGAVLLAAGPHAVEAHAPGYLLGQREVTIEGGVDRVVQIALEPEPERGAAAAPVPLRKKWWLWTSVAVVGAAGLATGLALGLRDPGEAEVYGGSTNMVIPVGYPDGVGP